MGEYSADLAWHFEGAVGPSSPVQQALEVLRTVIDDSPVPNVATQESYFAAPILATHTLQLMEGAGQLNGMGYHSAAVSLFRPIEDTLDVLAAISLVPGAADKWLKGKLKASDAAKLWVAAEEDNFKYVHETEEAISLSDYRKGLRSQFNKSSHCSLEQTEWNLYIEHDEDNRDFDFGLIPRRGL